MQTFTAQKTSTAQNCDNYIPVVEKSIDAAWSSVQTAKHELSNGTQSVIQVSFDYQILQVQILKLCD